MQFENGGFTTLDLFWIVPLCIHALLFGFSVWYIPKYDDGKENDLSHFTGLAGLLLGFIFLPYFTPFIAYRNLKQIRTQQK